MAGKTLYDKLWDSHVVRQENDGKVGRQTTREESVKDIAGLRRVLPLRRDRRVPMAPPVCGCRVGAAVVVPVPCTRPFPWVSSVRDPTFAANGRTIPA